MIRVEKEEETPTSQYDKHVIRAILVFGVG